MNLYWILLDFIVFILYYVWFCYSFIVADTRFTAFHFVDHATRVLVLIHYIYKLASCYLTTCLLLQTDFLVLKRRTLCVANIIPL